MYLCLFNNFLKNENQLFILEFFKIISTQFSTIVIFEGKIKSIIDLNWN